MFGKKKFLVYSVHAAQAFVFCLLLAFFSLGAFLYVQTQGKAVNAERTGKLAIVIDDFGLQRKGVKEMLALDCKLTVAVMPFLEYSEDDAENALENGKELMIHIPMQATGHDVPSHLGPRPIHADDTPATLQKWVDDALAELPEARGANIHMGTLCSTKQCVMEPVLRALKKQGLYFLDSKTSPKSICRKTARQTGICFYENEVFLEHESKSAAYIQSRLRKAMKIAKTTGSCIAIGHVGCEGGVVTAEVIAAMLPEFRANGVELVFVSELAPIGD